MTGIFQIVLRLVVLVVFIFATCDSDYQISYERFAGVCLCASETRMFGLYNGVNQSIETTRQSKRFDLHVSPLHTDSLQVS